MKLEVDKLKMEKASLENALLERERIVGEESLQVEAKRNRLVDQEAELRQLQADLE